MLGNAKDKQLLILGIGNLLWADEGFGVRAVEAFHRQYTFSDEIQDNVRLMDGGTQGLYLVPYVQQADILIVFDAIDYGLAPGTLKTLRNDAVPKFMGAKKMSLHQTGFQEVLATSQLLGDYPEEILLIGVQPEELDDYGGSLRPSVKEQILPAITIAHAFLEGLGVDIVEREQPLPPAYSLSDQSLDINQYESQRPSAQQACRKGDQRILASSAYSFDPKQVDGQPVNMSVNIDQRVQSPPIDASSASIEPHTRED